MSIAIGGDETGALVGDVGSAVSKFGFGGEDAPKCVLDSALGCVGGSESRGLEIDAEGVKSVQQALDRLGENRTTLVIAHRYFNTPLCVCA